MPSAAREAALLATFRLAPSQIGAASLDGTELVTQNDARLGTIAGLLYDTDKHRIAFTNLREQNSLVTIRRVRLLRAARPKTSQPPQMRRRLLDALTRRDDASTAPRLLLPCRCGLSGRAHRGCNMGHRCFAIDQIALVESLFGFGRWVTFFGACCA